MMDKDERKRRALQKKLRETREQFIAERDEVLRSLDHEKFMALFLKWQQPTPKFGGPEMVLAIMHRARLALPDTFNYSEKLTSALWLKSHNFELPAMYVLREGILHVRKNREAPDLNKAPGAKPTQKPN
jgi:hypothetical protein